MRDVSGVRFNWEAVRQRFPERTIQEIADLADVPLRTLDRLRVDPERSTLRNLIRIHRATGISLDDLVDDRAAA